MTARSGFGGDLSKAPGDMQRVHQHQQRGDDEHPAKAHHGGYAGAKQRACHITQIHKGLVVAKNPPGYLLATVFQQQRLYG